MKRAWLQHSSFALSDVDDNLWNIERKTGGDTLSMVKKY
jgi:hypothetical protein